MSDSAHKEHKLPATNTMAAITAIAARTALASDRDC